MKTKEQVEAEVGADFAKMEQALAAASPGVLDVLEVYGQAEAVIRQAEQYLSPDPVAPVFFDTDTSG